MIALCVAVSAAGAAAPPAPNSDPTVLPSLHETRLAVQARNALVNEPALAPLVDSSQIGVRVRQNVATLFGTVPSKELADKAVGCLRSLQKLQVLSDVRCELEIFEPTRDPRKFKSQVEKEKKPIALHAKSSGELASRNADGKPGPTKKSTTMSPHVDLKGPEGLRIGDDPRPAAGPAKDAVLLLQPVPLDIHAAASAPAKILPPKPLPPERSLYSRVEEIRKKDDRYSSIRVRVDGAIVYLTPGNAENLFDLAEEVSRLPGVAKVIVER